MFRILDEALPVDYCLGCWAKHMGRFSLVAGHTSFGDIFLLDPDSGQYAVLCPFTGERFPTSCFDRDSFVNGFLADPDIIERFSRPADEKKLRRRLGPVGNEEVYIPCPYPFAGGSGELSTFQKGGLWEFIELVGLFRGLGEPGQLEDKVEGTNATIELRHPDTDPKQAKPQSALGRVGKKASPRSRSPRRRGK